MIEIIRHLKGSVTEKMKPCQLEPMSLDPAASWIISQQETELDSKMEKHLSPGLRHS